MADKQDDTIHEIRGLKLGPEHNIYLRFEYIESELAEIKSALQVKGA
jgi:hypothetical protein